MEAAKIIKGKGKKFAPKRPLSGVCCQMVREWFNEASASEKAAVVLITQLLGTESTYELGNEILNKIKDDILGEDAMGELVETGQEKALFTLGFTLGIGA